MPKSSSLLPLFRSVEFRFVPSHCCHFCCHTSSGLLKGKGIRRDRASNHIAQEQIRGDMSLMMAFQNWFERA
jgi:hypothetical protein